MPRRMNILVACEESQVVTRKLRDLGHNAYSCDLLPCSGGKPGWHIQGDVLDLIGKNKNVTFKPMKGRRKTLKQWDMMIAHPPCTFLAVSGARWFYNPEDSDLPYEKRKPHPNFPNRRADQKEALEFVNKLWRAPIEKIALENPVGVISSLSELGKCNQIVQPYHFGDAATKTTCLWLRNLLPLKPIYTGDNIDKGARVYFKSGKSQPKWYADALVKAKDSAERRTLRSKTFEGMAEAFAYQWAGQHSKQSPKWLTAKMKKAKPEFSRA